MGVLALQGDFEAHIRHLHRLGPSVAETRQVRTRAQLDGLDGIILPGGESTTLLRLLRLEGLDRGLIDFHARGGVLFGTCAGLILLARSVVNPMQESLGLIDLVVSRNAFGRQVDSSVRSGLLRLPGEAEREAEMVFIRAPRIREVGPAVRILGRLENEPVLALSGRVLAGTFHPEMTSETAIHRFFVRLCLGAGRVSEEVPIEGPASSSNS